MTHLKLPQLSQVELEDLRQHQANAIALSTQLLQPAQDSGEQSLSLPLHLAGFQQLATAANPRPSPFSSDEFLLQPLEHYVHTPGTVSHDLTILKRIHGALSNVVRQKAARAQIFNNICCQGDSPIFMDLSDVDLCKKRVADSEASLSHYSNMISDLKTQISDIVKTIQHKAMSLNNTIAETEQLLEKYQRNIDQAGVPKHAIAETEDCIAKSEAEIQAITDEIHELSIQHESLCAAIAAAQSKLSLLTAQGSQLKASFKQAQETFGKASSMYSRRDPRFDLAVQQRRQHLEALYDFFGVKNVEISDTDHITFTLVYPNNDAESSTSIQVCWTEKGAVLINEPTISCQPQATFPEIAQSVHAVRQLHSEIDLVKESYPSVQLRGGSPQNSSDSSIARTICIPELDLTVGLNFLNQISCLFIPKNIMPEVASIIHRVVSVVDYKRPQWLLRIIEDIVKQVYP